MTLPLLFSLCLALALRDLATAAGSRPARITLLWAKLPLCVALLLLAACTRTVPAKVGAVPAQCDSMCLAPCDTTRPSWQPADPSSPDAWDEIAPQVVVPLGAKLDVCELHRRACAQCLERLRAAGVIL